MTFSSETPGYYSGNYKSSGLARGLFTQASSVHVPDGYSPVLENVFVNDRGNIRTRYGTQELLTGLSTTTQVYSFKSISNVTYLLLKDDLDLRVYRANEVEDKVVELILVENFTNVWSQEAINAVADFTLISEESQRVIICTGTNTPVQVQVTERQRVANNVTELQLLDPPLFDSVPLLAKVFLDGQLLTVATDYSIASNTITFTSAVTGTVDIVYFGWQWWTEAVHTYGFFTSRTMSRFNTGPSDKSIETPAELIFGIKALPNNSNKIPINIYENSLAASRYSYSITPTSVNQFAYSGGSYRSSGSTDKVLPGVTHVTFGATTGVDTDIVEINFLRALDISLFDGSYGLNKNEFRVFVEDTESLWIHLPVAGEFGTNYRAATFAQFDSQTVSSTGTEKLDYVLFDGNTSVGLPSNSEARVVRTAKKVRATGVDFIGSGAINGSTGLPFGTLSRARWWPAYGLSEHCNFVAGSFPKFAEIHENRLVLAGFSLKPSTVILSAVLDTTSPDDYYSDFQIRSQEGLPVNAVVIDINTTDSSGITGIKSTAGVLFIFTANGVYLVSGGETGITPTSKFVTQIAGVGAVNTKCIVNINDTIIFLSKNGLYALTQSFDAAGGWRVFAASPSINDKLKNKLNESYAWIQILPNEDTVYLAVVEGVATSANSLYVWKRGLGEAADGWTHFSDYEGFWSTSDGCFADLPSNYLFTVKGSRLVSYPYKYALDETSDLTVNILQINQKRYIQHTPFNTIPDLGIIDIGANDGGIIQKLNNNQVYIDVDVAYIYPKSINMKALVVYDENGKLDLSYSLNIETGVVTPALPSNTVSGLAYKCFALTPTMFASSTSPSSFLPSVKTMRQSIFVFHTDGEYDSFGVLVKKVDTDPTQVTQANQSPDTDYDNDVAFDVDLTDLRRELSRPLWKKVVHVGGIEDFYQFIVASDCYHQWELIGYQVITSQSSSRPGTGRY